MGAKASKLEEKGSAPSARAPAPVSPTLPSDECLGANCDSEEAGSPGSCGGLPIPFNSRITLQEQAILNQAEEFRKKYAKDDPEGSAAVQKLIDLFTTRPSDFTRGCTTNSKTSASASLAGSEDQGGVGGRKHSNGYSAYTAPGRWRNSGVFVHGTKFKHLTSILKQGLKASKSEIFMIDEIRPDGRVPGLVDPPEVLILIDEDKARRGGMTFDYDAKEGTWRTKGIDGVIRPWFFQRVVDQRPKTRGNVLFQSKDDPIMSYALQKPPTRLLHFTYWENVGPIMREGLYPAKNPVSETRRAFGDLLRGAENHVYAVEPLRARRQPDPVVEPEADNGMKYALNVVGLERPADAVLTIDLQHAERLGVKLDVVQSSDREETMYIKGNVPPEAIIGVEPNIPVELPAHLMAKIVDPKCFEDIPIIDISQDEGDVIKQLKYACEVVGFMQVIGHGISTELQERHMRFQKLFFELPEAQKNAIRTSLASPVRGYFGKGGENLDGVRGEAVDGGVPKKTVADNKEGLDLNGIPSSKPGDGYIDHIFGLPSQFPPEDVLPGFRETMAQYQDEMFKLSRRLLRLMAIILDLDANFFEARLTRAVGTHRLLHYWPIKDFKTEIGVGPHTDYGLLTILKQDSVGGLQVLNAKDLHWVHAVPIQNAFVINLGDMLARWTAHRFKSTVHRVVNISPQERYSVPFFLEPNLDSMIVPGELCAGPGGPPTEVALPASTVLDHFYTGAGMITQAHRDDYARRMQKEQLDEQ